MSLLNDVIGSGAITSFILMILAAEGLLYFFYLKRLRPMLATLAAGACLVLALRSALMQRPVMELGFFLASGFLFHVLEIWQWLKMSKNQ